MNDPGELCQRCGLCCDGTLFSHAPVLTPEADLLVALGLPIRPRADATPTLPQPCAALEGSRCRIYAQRPVACRGFDCLLHDAYAEDEVALPEALAIVGEARAEVAAVLSALPPSPASAFERLHDFLSSKDGEASRTALHARALKLDRFLDRQFRGRLRR
jgi:hypothetical protein